MNLAQSDTAPVRESESLDWPKLEDWLKEHINGLEGSMQVSQFHGGHANLTYCVAFDEMELVVRRQPFGSIAPGAHDMKREYRALSGLGPVYDRAPKAFAYCAEDAVIGAPFIVMERRKGLVVRSDIPEALRGFERVEERVSLALIDAMAELHHLDPVAIGLGELGRAEGFVLRQLKGWYGRWQLASDAENATFEAAYTLLLKKLPETRRHTLVHNDLKLDNCMFAADNPDRVATILDWDMTTLGDPLIELGTLLSYWREPGDQFDRSPTIDLDMGRFPSRNSLIERYASTEADVADIGWYEAFGLWKQVVVLQQLYRRLQRGETQDKRFQRFPAYIPEMLNAVLEMLKQ